MRVLVLTSSGFAPTYNSRTISQVDYINSFQEMHAELCNDLPLYEIEKKIIRGSYDCVFPAVVFGNSNKNNFSFNSTLYKILLYHGQDYIGSDIYTQMLLNDKALTNQRSGIGLPNKIVTRLLWENKKAVAMDIIQELSWPTLVKPNTLSASIGISQKSVVYSPRQAEIVIGEVFSSFPMLDEVLLEKYVVNAREYTVSVTGNAPWVFTVPTELISTTGTYEIYSNENKQMEISRRPIQYSVVSDAKISEQLVNYSNKLAKEFTLRDYCRFDFLADESHNIFLIDANTIPALGRNYMYSYTNSGIVRIEQLLGILLAVFSKRTGKPLPNTFLQALPTVILKQLGL